MKFYLIDLVVVDNLADDKRLLHLEEVYFFFRVAETVCHDKGFEFFQHALQVVHRQLAQAEYVGGLFLVLLYLPFRLVQQLGEICLYLFLFHDFALCKCISAKLRA